MLDLAKVLETLCLIEEDNSVPKNVRRKIKCTVEIIKEENGKSEEIRIDQVLQQLDDLSSDPNIPSYTRTQILYVVSNLESK